MDIYLPLLKSVGEHLGAAQLRLVRHVLAVGKRVDRSKEVIVAARAEVVDALAAEEAKAVAEDALRQRIAQVNRALRDMAGDGQPLFVLRHWSGGRWWIGRASPPAWTSPWRMRACWRRRRWCRRRRGRCL